MSKRINLIGFGLAGLAAGIVAIAGISASQAREDDSRATDTSQRVAPACLDGQRASRFQVVNDHTLLVFDDFGNAYKLDVGGPCRGMNDFSRFGFEFNGSTDICRAHDAVLLRTEEPGIGTMRCMINGVVPLSRAQANQLDKG